MVWLFNDFNHFSSDNSAALSALTMLYNHNHYVSPELLRPPKQKKIYKQLLLVKVKQETNILILLVKLKRMVMNKSQQFLKKLLTMKKNMLNCGLKN